MTHFEVALGSLRLMSLSFIIAVASLQEVCPHRHILDLIWTYFRQSRHILDLI